MSAAERIAITRGAPWADICAQHADEWVCLEDVEYAADDSIRAARVIAHDRSMNDLLARLDDVQAGGVIVSTGGRRLRPPRIEITDEIRDIVHARR